MNTTRVAKGALAGAIGGLAGALAMNCFQRWWSRTVHGTKPVSAAGRGVDRGELKVGATAVHFAFGAAMGGLYGASCELSLSTREMGGAAFGTAVWAVADEVASLSEHPPERRVHAFASHVVYGVTTEIVRRGVRALLIRRRPA